MKRLSMSKKILAIAGAGILIVALSGSALAMLGSGPTSGPTPPLRVEQHPSSPNTSAVPAPVSSPKPGSEVEFSGAIEVIAIDGWTISGQKVTVNADTRIKDAVTVGSLVTVQAMQQADDSLIATRIQSDDSGQGRGNAIGTSNGNSNENENQNGNINANENENGNGNHNENINSNENENENHNGNINVNENENENGNGNHNDNINSNENENGNGNHNDNINTNHNGGDDHGGNGNDNGNHNSEGIGNSNGND